MIQIEKNKVVSLIYELRENDPLGHVIEVLEASKPLTFIYGSGRLLPGFEAKLHSLCQGDNFSFILPCHDAYGDKREDVIINIPLSAFQADGKIDESICRVGNEVPMMDKDGNRVIGIITEVTDTYVRMDFNHPMAGRNLSFTGSILDVHEASVDELDKMLNSCSSCSSSGNGIECSGSCS
jgi:FKBP-type peptidyl-prolyl cis-trans isomerase SlyD